MLCKIQQTASPFIKIMNVTEQNNILTANIVLMNQFVLLLITHKMQEYQISK